MNLKIIFMPIFQDDHFITESFQVANFLSITGALFWGFLGDKLGNSSAILIYSFVDLFGKIYLSFCSDKTNFLIALIFVGFTEKAMIVFIGPALVKLYGL